MWTSKYAPTSSSEIIGQSDLTRKLKTWLTDWDDIHNKKTKKAPAFTRENPGSKACLVSGPPGVGKTSLANLVCNELGYTVVDMSFAEASLRATATNHTLGSLFSPPSSLSQPTTTKTKKVILLDGLDGVSSSEGDTGVSEIVKTIKLTKCPIICICNDRHLQKLKSLAGACYDLRAKRPDKDAIVQHLTKILEAENLIVVGHHEDSGGDDYGVNSGDSGNSMEIQLQSRLEQLVDEAGCDVRHSINSLHFSAGDFKSAGNKDSVLRITVFDACAKILAGGPDSSFSTSTTIYAGQKRKLDCGVDENNGVYKCNDRFNEHGQKSLDDRVDSFFVDYFMAPIFIQQNYVNSFKNNPVNKITTSVKGKRSSCYDMDKLSAASDAVGDIDLIGSHVADDWSLLPLQAAASVRAGNIAAGSVGFATFPQYLGKTSTRTKKTRLLNEFKISTSLASNNRSNHVNRLDRAPFTYDHIVAPILSQGKDGVSATISRMCHYNLSKTDVMESLKEVIISSETEIPSQVKAALTRAYNKTPFTKIESVEIESKKPQKKTAKTTTGKTKPDGRDSSTPDSK